MKFIKNSLWFCLLLVTAVAGCGGKITVPPDAPTTIILLRHAERTMVTSMLTERGRENADALVQELGSMNLSRIYSPNLARNLDTVRPLAKHLGIEISLWPVQGGTVDARALAVELLKNHPGETVLWVGNTDNLPTLYYALGGNDSPPTNYGDLYFVTVSVQGQTKVVKRSWGKN